MLALYILISRLILVGAYPFARLKAARGNQLWRDRLVDVSTLRPADIWLHAASAGETRIIGYLADYLLKQRPNLKIHVTTMTPAGRGVVESDLPPHVDYSFCPIDAPSTMKRFIDAIDPRIIVLAETEIWPNLIRRAQEKGIAVILVNGRMSEGAASRYRWVAGAMRRLLAAYDHFFFKTPEDAMRYAALGVLPDQSTVAGDMKFDAPLFPRSEGRRHEIRSRLGVGASDFVFVAGSTRPGEEAMLADLHDRLVSTHDRLRIAIAPRHLDRLDEIEALFVSRGIGLRRYDAATNDARVILVDRMGILNDIYMAADLAFVGGTLVDLGGHNLLEPVWAGTAVVYGPFLDNVRDAAEYIELHDFGRQVKDLEGLISLIEGSYHEQKRFAVKTEADVKNSPTATVGEYILSRL